MKHGSAFTGFLIVTVVAAIYFLPTLIAICSRRVNTLPIFLVNLVFGWTFFGWFAALTQGPQRIERAAPDTRVARVCHD